MAEFVSYEPSVEVVGEALAAFVGGFPEDLASVGLEILESQGLARPEPGKWYRLQPFLNAMKEISDRMGSHMLTRVGEQVASHGRVPRSIDTLLKFLDVLDAGYHMGHQGGEIGRYVHQHEGETNGIHRSRVVAETPYPCAFDLGNLIGWTRRFHPEGALDVVVRHDDAQPCRSQGGDTCTYLISWG